MTYCPFEDDCPFPDGRCTGDPFLGEDDCPHLMDISKEEWEEEMKLKTTLREKAENRPLSFRICLIQIRKAKGITRKQLAEMIGRSYQVVANWENANSMPSLQMIYKIADALGVSVHELIPEKVKEE